MSDFPTLRDAPTTWADVRPTHRDQLYDLRMKREKAWQLYYQAIDAGALDIVRECQLIQAEALTAEYDKAYHQLYDPPQECTCFLPEQTCDVCRSRHTNDDDPLPY